MKVCHILYSGLGGQAGVVFTLAAAAGDSGEQVLAFYGREPVAEPNVQGCAAQGLSYGYFAKGSGADLGVQLRMARWIGEQRPDVVVTHNPAAVLAARSAARRCGAKVVAVEHHSNALKGRKEWLMSLAAHRMAERTVYLTETYRDAVAAKLGRWFEAERTTVIPNGLALDLYRPRGAREGDRFVLGMQGRMVAGKDYSTLLRAVARLRHARFFTGLRVELAGDGPDRRRLQRMVRELRLDDVVVFLGMLPGDALRERMRGWDVALLSTLGETMSVALMEAQALGLPVVATAVTGVREAVEDGVNGLLVRAGDDAGMALKVVELGGDAGLRARLGSAARQYAESQLDAALMWERYERLFEKTINEEKASAREGAALARA